MLLREAGFWIMLATSYRCKLKLASLWYLAGASMLIAVAVLSVVPLPDTGVNDKFSHLITYSVLSAWFSLLVVRRRSLLWVAGGLIGYGALLEGLQGLTDYRFPEFADLVANSVGVVIGLLVFFTPLYRLLRYLDRRLAIVFQG